MTFWEFIKFKHSHPFALYVKEKREWLEKQKQDAKTLTQIRAINKEMKQIEGLNDLDIIRGDNLELIHPFSSFKDLMSEYYDDYDFHLNWHIWLNDLNLG
ncbi:hypothetical protein NXS15_01325 [Mycoplasma sp. CSL7475-4]|uniref:hypothetical protein n=1 Tax=Mycoplasma sp. CSL7475-4 TaxID=2973942 RepID=UPI00216B48A7|nr:hypothetical protein [Mycoplasma sp. CSL7475-4]MCS4536772.1 hypothetical protein [Mycoplasma sp. CSL7475-4]